MDLEFGCVGLTKFVGQKHGARSVPAAKLFVKLDRIVQQELRVCNCLVGPVMSVSTDVVIYVHVLYTETKETGRSTLKVDSRGFLRCSAPRPPARKFSGEAAHFWLCIPRAY